MGEGDARHIGDIPHIVGRPRFDPGEQRVVQFAVLLEEFSPGVRHGGGRLEKQQALRGDRGVHPPPGDLFDGAAVVPRRIVTKQREHEAVFAPRGAVARARVAARAEKDRHHIATKARCGRLGGACAFHTGEHQCEHADQWDSF